MAQLRARAESKAGIGARLRPDEAAISRALRVVGRFVGDQGLPPIPARHLAMVVEEWIANIVEHGGPHDGARIMLDLRLGDGVVHLVVSDAGRAFDPRAAAFEGPNPERGGGAGLAMIASLCRISEYTRRAGRNRLVFEMPVAG